MLKHDWQNLFLSCRHCNDIKGSRYDDILDPAGCDPEDHIALSLIIDEGREKIVVDELSRDKRAVQTANLLNHVYNGGTTDQKETECAVLRNAISRCMKTFLQYIKDYRDEPDIGYDSIIEDEISRSSAFAAFKRKIVRDDTELSKKFAKALA